MSTAQRYSSIYQRKQHKGSSRLLKKEEKKMRQQTFLYVFLGLVLLVLFIFIIVPNLIKFFFAIFDQESPFEIKDDVPPQVPVLSATPPEATFSAELNLAGFAEAESTVIFVLNGSELKQAQVDEIGQFAEAINLEKGDNELTLYGLDEAGNESLQSKSYQIVFDDEAPFINLITPEPDSVIELKKNRTTPISGETEPGAKVYLNDRLILADGEGKFSSTFYLNEGENTLQFKAIDRAGNQSELAVKVEFRQ